MTSSSNDARGSCSRCAQDVHSLAPRVSEWGRGRERETHHPQSLPAHELVEGDAESLEVGAVHGADGGAREEEERRRARHLEADRVEDGEVLVEARQVQLEADGEDRGARERLERDAGPGRRVRGGEELQHRCPDFGRNCSAWLLEDEWRRRVGDGRERERADGRDGLVDVRLRARRCGISNLRASGDQEKGRVEEERRTHGVAVGASGPPPSDGVASESAALRVACGDTPTSGSRGGRTVAGGGAWANEGCSKGSAA